MRILIVGGGVVGSNLAEELTKEGNDISFIDKDAEKIRAISEKSDVLTVVGDATRLNTLKSAGIENSEMFIAVTNVDEINIILCLLAAKLGVKTRIARVRNEDYSSMDHPLKLEEGLINSIINPDKIMVDSMTQTIMTPGANYMTSFADGELLLCGFDVLPDAPIIGKKLIELKDIASMDTFLIGGIYRNNKLIIPHGEDEIKNGDNIFVLVSKDTLSLFIPLVNKQIRELRRVIIYGANQTAINLARQLETKIGQVVLLSDSETDAEYASSQLAKTIVLKGKGTDLDILEQANISDANYFVALTNDDGINLTSSLLAKKHGSKRTIVLTQDPDYVPIIDSLGMDVVINPRLITSSAILEYIRRGNVRQLVKLAESEAEVIEMIATDKSKIVNKPLREIKFPREALVGAVIKNNIPVIPRGDTIIKPYDKVIIFSLPKVINQIEKLFT